MGQHVKDIKIAIRPTSLQVGRGESELFLSESELS